MPDHICTERDRLERMEAMLLRIDGGLRGNGKPGLFTEFAVWKNTVLGLLAVNMLLIAGFIGLWIKK